MEAPRHLYRHAFQLRILLGERERERERERETDGRTDRRAEMDQCMDEERQRGYVTYSVHLPNAFMQ